MRESSHTFLWAKSLHDKPWYNTPIRKSILAFEICFLPLLVTCSVNSKWLLQHDQQGCFLLCKMKDRSTWPWCLISLAIAVNLRVISYLIIAVAGLARVPPLQDSYTLSHRHQPLLHGPLGGQEVVVALWKLHKLGNPNYSYLFLSAPFWHFDMDFWSMLAAIKYSWSSLHHSFIIFKIRIHNLYFL